MASEPPDSQTLRLVARSAGRIVTTFDLPAVGELVLGSSSKADCALAGERYLSRRHVVLKPDPPRLHVERLASASNPVLFKGVPADRFHMNPGDYFVVGSTTFHFEGPPLAAGPVIELDPHEQFTLAADELRVSRDAADRLRLLDLMELPEILRTRSRKEFFIYACASYLGLFTRNAGARTVFLPQPRRVRERFHQIFESVEPVKEFTFTAAPYTTYLFEWNAPERQASP